MTFSPKKRDNKEMDLLKPKRAKWFTVKIQYSPEKEEENEPILILKHFSTFPYVSFDKVTVGKSKTCSLRVQNPLQELQQVRIEKFPHSKGFHIPNTEFEVEAGKQLILDITWSPTEALNCREIISFRTSSGCKTQAYLIGSALSPVKKKKCDRSRFSFRKNLGNGKKVLPKTETHQQLLPRANDNKENLAVGNSFQKLFSPEAKNMLKGKVPTILAVKQDDNAWPESPIRRQTYIINEMFEDASMSNGSRCIRHEISTPRGENSTFISPAKQGTFNLSHKQEVSTDRFFSSCPISPTLVHSVNLAPANDIRAGTTNNTSPASANSVSPASVTNGILSPEYLESGSENNVSNKNDISEINASDKNYMSESEIDTSDKNYMSVSEIDASDKNDATVSDYFTPNRDFVSGSLTKSLKYCENQSVISDNYRINEDATPSKLTPEIVLNLKTIVHDSKLMGKEKLDISVDNVSPCVEGMSNSLESVEISGIDYSLSEAQDVLLSSCISDFVQRYHITGQEKDCSLDIELSILRDISLVSNISPFKSSVPQKEECTIDNPSEKAKDYLNVPNTPCSPPCYSDSFSESNAQLTPEPFQRCSTGIMPDIPDMTIPSQFLEVTNDYHPSDDKTSSHNEDDETKDDRETVTDQFQEEIVTDQLQQETVTDQLQQETVTDQLQKETVTDQLQQETGTDQLQQETVTDQLQQETVTDQLQQETVTDQLQQETVTDRLQQETVTDRLQQETVTDRLQQETVTDRLQQETVTDRLQQETVTDQLQQETVTDQLQQETVTDQLQQETVTDQLQQETVTDQLQKDGGVSDTVNCSKAVVFDVKLPSSGTKSVSRKAAKHFAARRRCQTVGAKKSPPLKEVHKHKISPKQTTFKVPAIKHRSKLNVAKPDAAKKTPTKNESTKTDNSIKKTPVTKKKTLKVCPKRLHLLKTPAAVPAEETIRHPNIFAARNMYYDERWMEKQETAFTRWLNFVLTPPEELKTPDQDSKVDGAKLWIESMKGSALVRAPTKDDMSLRIYTAIRMMNQLRFASCKLYQSDEVTSVIKRLEKEIELKRLLVRKERQMHADVGIKQHLLVLLLSYNPLWLRIGLETIYGEFIPMQSNKDIHGLSRFIIKRFLNNPDIAAKYAHPTVPHSYKPGFEEEMKKFTLKKFLLLVYYLDVAKTKRLINHDPCLFCKGSELKASRDLLLVFSREYLSGEGDVTRHLKQLGYVVSQQQTALDEFDYSVTNIAVDLRCGLRLARVMELLLQDWSLCISLRIPAISRLQKVHNNEIAMKAFTDAGHQIEGDVTARDLVNGHREKTLDFLWQIIFKTQISRLVDIKKLKSEIEYLKRNLKLRADVAAFNAIRMPVKEPETYQTEFLQNDQYAENECIRLLFLWCQVVCGHYDLKVHNFTVSFSDGRALCYLIHHYHPHILPLDAVKQNTSTGYFEQKEIQDFDEICDNPFGSSPTMANMEQLVKNEKENLKLVFEKLQDIGGVPIVTQISDMSNTIPDEKVVMTLVAYLNIRLMDLSQEIRAARVIQLAWRNKHLRKRQEQLWVEIKAITVIQRMVRNFLDRRRLKRMKRASLVIQSYWRMRKAKQELKALRHQKHLKFLSSKAVIIQATFRGYSMRQNLKKMNAAAMLIQSHYRCWAARSKFLTLKGKVIVLQQHYRAMKLGAKQREEYFHIRQSVILTQACCRRWLAKQAVDRRKRAIVKLQAYLRQLICRQRYLKMKQEIIAIQQRYRRKLLSRKCRKEFQQYRSAALQIQHWYRCCLAQNKENRAAIVIQAHFRRRMNQKRYSKMRNAILLIQRKWKATILCRREREKFLAAKKLKENREKALEKVAKTAFLNLQAIRIQRFYRSFKAQKLAEKQLQSAIIIQHWFRGLQVRLQFLRLKKSTCLFQAAVRARLARKRQAAVCIQAHVRSWLVRKQIQKQHIAAAKIQHWFRGVRTRLCYLRLRKKICLLQVAVRSHLQRRLQAVTVMQAHARSWLVRRQIQKQNVAAAKIQGWFRGMKTRLWFLHLRKTIRPFQIAVRAHLKKRVQAAVCIQSHVRSWLIRRQLQKEHLAVVKLQRWFRAMRMRLWFLRLKKNTRCFQDAARLLLRKRVKAAVCIQSFVRSWLTRREIRKQCIAVIKIQRWFRGLRPRLCFLRLRQNTCLFQHAARARLQKRLCAVICIQSWTRSWLVRKQQKERQKSAIKIQRWFREMKTRLWFLRFRKQICVFQVAARIHLVRKLNATICIQSRVRSWLVGRELKKQKISAVKIQHWFMEMKVRFWFLKLRKNTRLFQAAARAVLQKRLQAAICLQSYARRWLVQKQIQKEQKAATKIQALWRAYKIRSIRNRSVAAARERIKQATASASPDQTLASRTATALDYLLKYRTMYQLLCALINLDVATRLSPVCCEQLASSGGIEIIIQLIKSCNRSVPHMEVIKYSANVLLNISKYEKTVKAVWEAAESLEVIIEMMRIFREKGSAIFTKCCSLLWILCQELHRSEVIKEDTKITDQIISLHYLAMRKKKMDDKHLVKKLKMAECFGSSFLHSTLAPKPKRSLQIQPDWILGNKVMREFADPVTAICAVMKTLCLREK